MSCVLISTARRVQCTRNTVKEERIDITARYEEMLPPIPNGVK